MLAGVAPAEFGVGGDGQVALGAGGGVPVGAVGRDHGEHGLALAVGLVQGVVAGCEILLADGGAVIAAVAGGRGLGAGAQAGQAGFTGGQGLVPGGAQVRCGRDRFRADRVGGVAVAG